MWVSFTALILIEGQRAAKKFDLFSRNSFEAAVQLPWVPEAFLARFPVAAYVLYCDPRKKPLDQSAIALMTPSQWLACLNWFSPEFGSSVWLAPNSPPRYSKSNSLCHWLTRIVCRGIVICEIYQVYRSRGARVSCVEMEDCEFKVVLT